MGLSQDLSAVDFGTRTKRYALIIDDLKVTYVGVRLRLVELFCCVLTLILCRSRPSARYLCRARTRSLRLSD